MNLLTHYDSSFTKYFLKKFDYHRNKAITYTDFRIQDVLGATVINLKKEEVHLYDGLPE